MFSTRTQPTVARSLLPGIDPSEAERVFDEFFTTKADGLGLGLSISKSIVEAHGGKLTLVESSPNGATFRLTLPAMMTAVG